jgi:hypothetical protein
MAKKATKKSVHTADLMVTAEGKAEEREKHENKVLQGFV